VSEEFGGDRESKPGREERASKEKRRVSRRIGEKGSID